MTAACTSALWLLLSATPIAEEIRARGVAPESVVIAFAGSPAIARFAAEAVDDSPTDLARAHALYDAILALKRAKAIEGDRDNTPKRRPPKTAAQLMAIAAAQGDYDRRAGCYELSALYVAAARSVGLEAVGVERDDSVGTGQIGHIMAGVRFEAGGRLTVYDLQNQTLGSRSRIRELGDLELAAHHYNHLAVAAYLSGEMATALAATEAALRLAPDSPSFLNNHATVLVAHGEHVLAVAQATHAVELAPDVPLYRYQLGRLQLASGRVRTAIPTLEQALALKSRYGIARRDLGWAYLLANRPIEAKRELARALRDDSKTPEGHLYLALLHVAEGREKAAREVVEEGLERDAQNHNLRALAAILGKKRGETEVEAAKSYLVGVLENVATTRSRLAKE